MQAQPEPVRDTPPPSIITPRFVPASKAAPLPAIPMALPAIPALPMEPQAIPVVPVAPPAIPVVPVAPPPIPVVVTPALPLTPAVPAPPRVVPAFTTEAPALPISVGLRPLSAQATKPGMPDSGGFDSTIELNANIELPGPQRYFRRESEKEFFERIAQDKKRTGNTSKAIFPQEPIISKEPFQPRAFPRVVRDVEPCYVLHRRLYFEQPNFERTGYDFGVLTPAMCVGAFYYDLVLLPYHFWTDPQDRTECSAGKCLPGDQAPFLIPRERFSVTGLLGMTGAATGISLLFP